MSLIIPKFSATEFCRAYTVSLGRLEETKPVEHKHDWVRITLAGTVQWLSGDAPNFKNLEKTPARFVLLKMK